MAFGQYTGGIGAVVGGIIGGVIGSYVPYIGTYAGASLGAALGGAIGGVAGSVFWPEKVDVEHPPPPQPHETRVQISTYGAAIPIQYGSGRLAGNIIYMSDIKETIDRSRHRQDGVRYYEMAKTYTSTFAVAFCEGPIIGYGRIWINNKVFADWRDPDGPFYPSGDSGLASANLDTSIARGEAKFSMYFGLESQSADPTLSVLLTAAETPTYRGIAYIVFVDFPIGEFSGIPTIEIELAEEVDIYPESPSLNPELPEPPTTWTSINFTEFTENDSPGNITISSNIANITRASWDYGDCWVEKTFSETGNFSFRFTVEVISIGDMTNSTRVLRLLNIYTSGGGPYFVAHFYFDDGPASYDYSIGVDIESASQHYSYATMSRYIELVQNKATTEFTINIYSDPDFSVLEFSDSKTDANYGFDITKIEMIDAYSATGIDYQIQVENFKYKVI